MQVVSKFICVASNRALARQRPAATAGAEIRPSSGCPERQADVSIRKAQALAWMHAASTTREAYTRSGEA
jgi:hypothetical protein